MASSFLDDLMRGARLLRARPGFSAAVVLTLALGIGCNTAVFAALSGLLLQPLPYPHAERLVRVHNVLPSQPDARVTVADYVDRREQADVLEDSALWYEYGFDLTGREAPLRVQGVVATPSLFTTLGIRAQLGRTFEDGEAQPVSDDGAMWVQGAPVAVLSDAFWRDELGADPAVVGRDVLLGGRAHRVVGVLPPGFAFPNRGVQVFVPFAFSARQKSDAMRGFDFAESVARLRPGATVADADAQLAAISRRTLQRLGGDADVAARIAGYTGRAVPLRDHLAGDKGPALWLLQAAVATLLLVACANVATLVSIRLSARRRELAVRAALGATRARIARQLLAETLVLTALGGGAGLAVALAGVALVRTLGLDGAAHGFHVSIDGPVVAFAVASTLATALAAGVAPLLAIGTGRAASMHDGARGTTDGRSARATHRALVVAQLALSVALLAGAALLLQSLWRLLQQDPGFARTGTVTASLQLARDRYAEPGEIRRFHAQLLASVRALPGVRAAGLVSGVPFSTDFDSGPWFVDESGTQANGWLQAVDEHAFDALGIPLLEGRAFRAGDDEHGAPVAIVDAQLARRAFGTQSAIGRRLGTHGVDGPVWRTIVGVVGSVKRNALSETDGADTYYFPIRQAPTRVFRLVVRSTLDTGPLERSLRGAVAAIDPEQPVFDVMTLEERVERSLDGRRAALLFVGAFAAVALGLCIVGVHGVLAFGVAQRSGEFGVRMALGADRGRIVRLVLAEGGRIVAVGLALGLALALAFAHQLRAQLFGVGEHDAGTFVIVLALVAATGLLACWLPARRAAATSPMQALREE